VRLPEFRPSVAKIRVFRAVRFYTERPCDQIEGWLAANCMAEWEVQLSDVDWDTDGAMWKRLVVNFFDPSDRKTFVTQFFGS